MGARRVFCLSVWPAGWRRERGKGQKVETQGLQDDSRKREGREQLSLSEGVNGSNQHLCGSLPAPEDQSRSKCQGQGPTLAGSKGREGVKGRMGTGGPSSAGKFSTSGWGGSCQVSLPGWIPSFWLEASPSSSPPTVEKPPSLRELANGARDSVRL